MIENNIKLRPVAHEDREMIFNWRNMPFLVNLGSSGKTISWQEHCKWFDKVMQDKNIKLFVIQQNSTPIGQLRYDLNGTNEYTVTIYVLQEYTGKGIGPIALRKGSSIMLEMSKQNVLIAFIKDSNKASISAFLKAGFEIANDYANPKPGHVIMKYSKKLTG